MTTKTGRHAGASAAVRICQMLAAAPGVLVAAASLLWFAGGLVGGGLWPPRAASLPEAAAVRNRAEAARLIALGHDPNRPAPVRAGFVPGVDEALMTPLEAAVAARQAGMVRMLLDHGASPSGPQLAVLRCLADSGRDADIEAMLSDLSSDPWPDCEGVELPTDRP